MRVYKGETPFFVTSSLEKLLQQQSNKEEKNERKRRRRRSVQTEAFPSSLSISFTQLDLIPLVTPPTRDGWMHGIRLIFGELAYPPYPEKSSCFHG